MSARCLMVLLVAYLTFDLTDSLLPGVYSFKVRVSEIEDAAQVQRSNPGTVALAGPTTPPERRVRPRRQSLARQRPAGPDPPVPAVVARRPGPARAAQAPTAALGDHHAR